MKSQEQLVSLLLEILREPVLRGEKVAAFQDLVWAGLDPTISRDVAEVLRGLAYDLDFFEMNTRNRREDSVLFGHRRLEEEIREGLRKLRAAGVVIPEVE